MNAILKLLRTPIPMPWLTFDFYLDVGLFRVHTALWRTSYERDCREYVRVLFDFWGRPVFRFNLFETGMSRMQRKANHGKGVVR